MLHGRLLIVGYTRNQNVTPTGILKVLTPTVILQENLTADERLFPSQRSWFRFPLRTEFFQAFFS